MNYVKLIQCPLSSTETDTTNEGVAIGVTRRVRCMRADFASSNYLAKANFRIEITKLWPIGMHGRQLGPSVKIELTKTVKLSRVEFMEVDCSSMKLPSEGKMGTNVSRTENVCLWQYLSRVAHLMQSFKGLLT